MMRILLLILVSLFLNMESSAATPIYAEVLYDNNDNIVIKTNSKAFSPHPETLSYGSYDSDIITETGWTNLEVIILDSASSVYTDDQRAYAAGYLEGYLTYKQIYQTAMNIQDGKSGFSDTLSDFINKNNEYIKNIRFNDGNVD